MLTPAFGTSRGAQPQNVTVFAVARVAFNAYEVGQFDIAYDSADTLNDIIGDANGSLSGVIKPTAAGIICGALGLWQQSVGAGQIGKILLVGEAYGKQIKASGDISRMDQLCATTDGYLSPDHTAGDRVIAMARENLTAPSAATVGMVLFEGIHGLAQFVV